MLHEQLRAGLSALYELTVLALETKLSPANWRMVSASSAYKSSQVLPSFFAEYNEEAATKSKVRFFLLCFCPSFRLNIYSNHRSIACAD